MNLTRNLLLEIAFVTPLVCFVASASYEFRSRRSGAADMLSLLAPALGAIFAVLLLVPLNLAPQRSGALSNVMVVLSVLIAASGLLVRYKSTIAKILVPLGGALLAFFWFFNRTVA
jgi:hypothetical protein